MKKEAYYFSHDANARNDIKVVKLRRVVGWEGYGLFWALVEMLREEPEHKLSMATIDDISFHFSVKSEILLRIINDFGLFKIEENYFSSVRLNKSMDEYNELKTKLKEAGRKGGYSKAKRWLQPSQSHPLASKGNKIKEKKNSNSPFGYKKTGTGGDRFIGPTPGPEDGMVI